MATAEAGLEKAALALGRRMHGLAARHEEPGILRKSGRKGSETHFVFTMPKKGAAKLGGLLKQLAAKHGLRGGIKLETATATMESAAKKTLALPQLRAATLKATTLRGRNALEQVFRGYLQRLKKA
jgi:hypothetical protein